ncbi:MAG: L-threonylcarbamoyladenylate synthase [Bryobacteraceae bacterium]
MTFPSSEAIKRAAKLIGDGELVVFPTETVYGLGANALDADAVRKIYDVKGRPLTSPLIVHVGSSIAAKVLAEPWSKTAQKLADRWWPGPLTLVVPKSKFVPDIVTAGLPTVGLRVPAHPVALALLHETQFPLAAPSANRFTELSPTTAEHVRRSLGDRVAMILDGGPCTVGIESTVVSLAGPEPVLLRPGMISRREIEEELDMPLRAHVQEGEAHPSPGLHPRHYSPRTPLYLLPCKLPPGRGVTVEDLPRDPAGYAAHLYERLHALDQQGWDWIAIEAPPDTPEWAAVLDRLRRAANPAA